MKSWGFSRIFPPNTWPGYEASHHLAVRIQQLIMLSSATPTNSDHRKILMRKTPALGEEPVSS